LRGAADHFLEEEGAAPPWGGIQSKRRQVLSLVVFPLTTVGLESALSGAGMFFAGGFGAFGTLPLFLLMIVAMYMLMVLPQQRKQKQWNAMLASIKSGDKVTTNGGIRGTVVSVKDDTLIVRTAPDGVKLEFAKSAIAAVTTDEPAAKSENKSEK
jgi:preprotein translocase subunit YajC